MYGTAHGALGITSLLATIAGGNVKMRMQRFELNWEREETGRVCVSNAMPTETEKKRNVQK